MSYLIRIWEWVKKYWQFFVGGIITLFLTLVVRGSRQDDRLKAERSKSDLHKKESDLALDLIEKQRQDSHKAKKEFDSSHKKAEDKFHAALEELEDDNANHENELKNGDRKDIIEGLKDHLK